jgi:hypothetical protein
MYMFSRCHMLLKHFYLSLDKLPLTGGLYVTYLCHIVTVTRNLNGKSDIQSLRATGNRTTLPVMMMQVPSLHSETWGFQVPRRIASYDDNIGPGTWCANIRCRQCCSLTWQGWPPLTLTASICAVLSAMSPISLNRTILSSDIFKGETDAGKSYNRQSTSEASITPLTCLALTLTGFSTFKSMAILWSGMHIAPRMHLHTPQP